MFGDGWREHTYGGHPVVIYETGVHSEAHDNHLPRSIFGRVQCRGQWLPQAWSKIGRAYADKDRHSLDLVPKGIPIQEEEALE